MRNILLMALTAVLLVHAAALGDIEVQGDRPAAFQPLGYVFTGTESQITKVTNDQFDPHICDDIVVYSDRRNADADVYYYDLVAESEVPAADLSGDQLLTAVSEDYIVYTDYGTGEANIMIYDLHTGDTTRINSTLSCNHRRPAVSGKWVVWEDDRHGNYDIYAYNISASQEYQLTTDLSHQRKPAISGTTVVYEDFRNGNADIYMYDLVSQSEEAITTDPAQDVDPDIDGDFVVFGSNRFSVGDIFYYDVTTSALEKATSGGDYERNPQISNGYIVYETYAAGDANVALYSIRHSAGNVVVTDPAEQYLVDISGNRIAYTDNRNDNLDIYLFEFELPCCAAYDMRGRTGNVDYDPAGIKDLNDVLALASYAFLGGAVPACLAETNVDGDSLCIADLTDVLQLAAYAFLGGDYPAYCMSDCE